MVRPSDLLKEPVYELDGYVHGKKSRLRLVKCNATLENQRTIQDCAKILLCSGTTGWFPKKNIEKGKEKSNISPPSLPISSEKSRE